MADEKIAQPPRDGAPILKAATFAAGWPAVRKHGTLDRAGRAIDELRGTDVGSARQFDALYRRRP